MCILKSDHLQALTNLSSDKAANNILTQHADHGVPHPNHVQGVWPPRKPPRRTVSARQKTSLKVELSAGAL